MSRPKGKAKPRTVGTVQVHAHEPMRDEGLDIVFVLMMGLVAVRTSHTLVNARRRCLLSRSACNHVPDARRQKRYKCQKANTYKD